LENLGENGNLKKKTKTFLKEKRGEKQSLLLMSFIISIESFLSLMNASWWPCVAEKPEVKPKPSVPHRPPRDTHTPHAFSDTHRSACWLYQTLLLLPAEINLKKKNNFKKDKKIND